MGVPKRLLIVNRHFWPDLTTYGQILRHIAERWAQDGHLVDVLAAHPSYRPEISQSTPSRDRLGDVNIFRVRLFPFRGVGLSARLLNSIPFFLGFIWHMASRRLSGLRYDYVLVSTNPPVLEALLARLLCAVLGGRIIYHIQDLHPEVEVSGGVFKNGGLADRFFRMLDQFSIRGAAACVTLSEDMRQAILRRPGQGSSHQEIHVINNFIFDLDDTLITPPADLARSSDRFRVIFAGNIGHFQGLEQLIAAARELSDEPEIEFVLLGNGIAVEPLKALAGDRIGKNIHFVPVQPMHVASAMVEDADLAVIMLSPGVIRFAYPSKTMTYAASGTPILAVVEPDSELALTVERHGLGFVTGQEDVWELAQIIRKAYEERETVRAGRSLRRKTGHALFSQADALNSWSKLIADLSRRP